LAEAQFAATLTLEYSDSMPVNTKLIYALKDEYLPPGTSDELLKVKNLELEAVNEYHTWFFGREAELASKMHEFLQ
jgi:hypothetical protein